MSLSPILKTPFTDFTGAVVSHQWGSRCRDFELKALDCLEAYGLDRGLTRCENLISDFQECSLRIKEVSRYTAMRAERDRQYSAGERTKENRYATAPRSDSY